MRRDHPDVFEVGTGPPPLQWPASRVIAALGGVVTQRRLQRLQAVATGRVAGVVPLLERIADPHNASAILRSADAFGLQEVVVVPHQLGFAAARGVSMGTHRWLDIEHQDSTETAVASLRQRGFKIAVADMHGAARPEDLPDIERLAVAVGNEHHGPSEALRAAADLVVSVPMRGFVESLNVSVAAAILLYHATRGRAALSENERRDLTARYLLASVRDAERIVGDYSEEPPPPSRR